MDKTTMSGTVNESEDDKKVGQEKRVWTLEEIEEEKRQGNSKRRFLVGEAGRTPIYVTIKKLEAAIYADVINVEPRGIAVTHRRRERVLFFDADIRSAVHCIRDLCKEKEVEVLRRYTDVVSVGEKDHHYLQEGAKERLLDEADRRVLAEYRTAAMTVEKVAEMVDKEMAPVLKECAKEIRVAMGADRRFRE